MSVLKFGIVGLGRAGNGMHLPELMGKEDRIKVVAVCDLIEEAKRIAEKK